MPGYKRMGLKRPVFKRTYKKRTKPTTRAMYNIAKKVVNRNIETKHVITTATDGPEIYHNNFVLINDNPLRSSQGTADDVIQSRIGDRINVKGVSFRMMLELNERYSDVTFRIMLVRFAKGDTPTRSTLFKGLSGNKMIDAVDHERYKIIAQKYLKLKAPNISAPNPVVAGGAGSGITGETTYGTALSRATRIVKMWIPGSKFAKNGLIKYENATQQVQFFDHHLIVYAYSNYSTLQDVYYVGRVNDCVTQLYFKDA